MHRKLQEDCRPRRWHREVLEVITHDGAGDLFDGYTIWPWATLCEAVAKLRVDLPARPSCSHVVAITPSITPRPQKGENPVEDGVSRAGWMGLEAVGREGNPESCQTLTRNAAIESVSENAHGNGANNENITRVIARLAAIGRALEKLPLDRLRDVAAPVEALERIIPAAS